jgi:type III secretion system IpaD/SipD/SspD family effector
MRMTDFILNSATRVAPAPRSDGVVAEAVPGTTQIEQKTTNAPKRSSQADALERLHKRGDELRRLTNQPDIRTRTSVAMSAHLFASDAQSVLASLQSRFQMLPTGGLSFAPLMAALHHARSEAPGNAPLASDPPSFEDILDGLQDLIGIIREDYLDVYARLVEKFSNLYSDFNAEILSKLERWMSATGDKGEIEFDCAGLGQAIQDLIDKYSYPNDAAIVFPEPGEGASREDAEKWLKAMGLPASCLVDKGDGTFCVVLDLTPFTQMKASLPSTGKLTFPASEFQAWQNGFNALQQEVESTLQKHTQKYSNANSIHDNVQKTISSTLSALFDMLKAFASALG